MIGVARKRTLSTVLLPWAPPALDPSRRVVEITNSDLSNRVIELDTGEDCEIRFMEPIGFAPIPWNAFLDAQVTVIGGRNVVTMGAQTAIDSISQTTLTAPAATDATVLTVASTAGFPDAGVVRVNGEGIRYSAKTDTTFTIAERNFGFSLSVTGTPPLALSAGATVYIGEQYRGGISYRSQTGFVHTEGALIEGSKLIDGIRVRGSSATTHTIQNTRVGPNQPTDVLNMTDGHSDGLQTWGSGVKLLRMSHFTFLGGVNGRCIINAANTSGGGEVERIELRDGEFVDALARRNSLVTNSDAGTVWTAANVWLVTTRPRATAAPEKGDVFMLAEPDGRYLVDRSGLGVGYVSPGYQS